MFSLHEFSAGMVSHISNKSNLKKKKKDKLKAIFQSETLKENKEIYLKIHSSFLIFSFSILFAHNISYNPHFALNLGIYPYFNSQ